MGHAAGDAVTSSMNEEKEEAGPGEGGSGRGDREAGGSGAWQTPFRLDSLDERACCAEKWPFAPGDIFDAENISRM